MSKIGLPKNTFAPIPEGEYDFVIEDARYKEDFGKVEVKCRAHDRKVHVEKFNIVGKNHQTNSGALMALATFVRQVLDDNSIDEIDPETLIGRRFHASIEHDIVDRREGDGEIVFAHLRDIVPQPSEPATATDDDFSGLLDD